MLYLQLCKKIWSVHALAFVIGRYSSFAFVLLCTCTCTSADYWGHSPMVIYSKPVAQRGIPLSN